VLESLFLADPVFAFLQLARGFLAFSIQLLSDRGLIAVDLPKCLEAKLLTLLG
jgi:hypothetical protein